MSVARWHALSRGAFVVALLAIAGAWLPWAWCSWQMADAMQHGPGRLGDAALIQAYESLAQRRGEAFPASLRDRAAIAAPVCYRQNPLQDALPYYVVFLLTLVLGFFSRNQVRLAKAPRDTPAEPARAKKKRTRRAPASRSDPPAPEAIEVSDELNLSVDKSREEEQLEAARYESDDSRSLMAFVEEQRQLSESMELGLSDVSAAAARGLFCPPGFEDKPILFVDTASHAARDDWERPPFDDPARPYKSLQAALAVAAREVAGAVEAVQVRVSPGIYQASLRIPDRVVVVNHRLPQAESTRRRLAWLSAQNVDDPERVTIYPPADAACAVAFEPGQLQGIFGCYLVGREGTAQTGAMIENSRALALVNCAFESFTEGAIRIESSGTELAGQAVIIHGCLLRNNRAKLGAGLCARRSSVTIDTSIFEDNQAGCGGAIFAEDLRSPLVLKDSRLAKNRALLPSKPKAVDPGEVDPAAWQRAEGHGGALFVKEARLRVVDSEFVENGASLTGGAIALLGAQAVISHERRAARFSRNRARIGGALAAIGWSGAEATLKLDGCEFEQNRARQAGGALAGLGACTIQCTACELVKNITDGPNSVGGAVSCHTGAALVLVTTQIVENRCAGSGGGIGVVNARLKLGIGSKIRENDAAKDGGGIFAVSCESETVEKLRGRGALELPFVITLESAKIASNRAGVEGGGLRAGNLGSEPTFPLALRLDDMRIQVNRAEKGLPDAQDIWITWCDTRRGWDDERPDKLLLE